MDLKYLIFTSVPNADIAKGIADLHEEIFSEQLSLEEEMQAKPRLVIVVALQKTKAVVYKIGYELNERMFYSWLGGVGREYRNQGIASALMKKQHEYLRNAGYCVVQTKTKNEWRSMLLLNIKHGFDVMETYYNARGIHKIMLEKKL